MSDAPTPADRVGGAMRRGTLIGLPERMVAEIEAAVAAERARCLHFFDLVISGDGLRPESLPRTVARQAIERGDAV
jgi:alkanesulfonate monooxygenase SsuD/methylene tetrahydromethanopterin reductase-like flavin-dependent oxidoreductase (luciferase family)